MFTPNKIKLNREQSNMIPLTGGLNEQVSNAELKSGELIVCANYIDQEDVYSGYSSVRGYERYDGTALASDTSLDSNFSEGDVGYDQAREAVRIAINTVGTVGTTCTGPVTGVHLYNDILYAWRNNTAQNATKMFKASGSSWVEIDLSTAPMTQNATVKAINGQFSSYNTNLEVMAWVDGVTNGFWLYNGTTVTYNDNTSSGGYLPNAAPTNLGIWRNRLFIIYPNGHILFSVAGDPTDFDTSTGYAGEIYLGENCTDIEEAPEGTLALFTKDSIKLLYYGSVADDFIFKLDTYSNSVGAKEGTAKSILGQIYFADAQGLCSLSAVQTYGDFGAKNISKKIQQSYTAARDNIQFSIADIGTGRYYLFYTDAAHGGTSGLVFTFKGQRLKGSCKVIYPEVMSSITEARYNNGNRDYFFGTNTGYVMKMFSGTSFDGQAIESYFTTSYYHYKSPRLWKFFHRLKFEASSASNFNGNIRSRFNYSESSMPKTVSETFDVYGNPGYWGDDYWGQFYWATSAIGGSMYYFTGYGTNMSITVRTSSKYKPIHTIHNFTVDYSIQSTQV